MSTGGETADQAARMTLEGIEVVANAALTIGGAASRSLAVTLYAILTDKKKIRGKTRLNSLLKSDKELKVYAIRHDDLKKFCEEAKKYGVLYCVLKEKDNTDGICDILVRAEDASKISRIVEKFELANIDTKAIRETMEAEKQLGYPPYREEEKLTSQQHDELVNAIMESMKLKGEDTLPLEAQLNQRSENQLEHSSTTTKNSFNKEKNSLYQPRPSVRKELNKLKAESASKNANTLSKSKSATIKNKQKLKPKER